MSVSPVAFHKDDQLKEPRLDLRLCRDEDSLYIAYHRAAATRDGEALPLVAAQSSPDDAQCWKDDDLEIFVSDTKHQKVAVFGVSCAGGRCDGLYLVAIPGLDWNAWDGEWEAAVSRTEAEWTAEIAIPFSQLEALEIDPKNLVINVQSRNLAGAGPGEVWLTHPAQWPPHKPGDFRAILADEPGYTGPDFYTARLHFAEMEEVSPGERVFDVRVQGETAIEALNVAGEAGGREKALVREVSGIPAAEVLLFELVTSPQAQNPELPPILSAIEILGEEREKEE
jgi:hypothetical protein